MAAADRPLLHKLQRDGFVIIPSLLDRHMLLGLKAASKYTTDAARSGRWPHVRIVPKQYPPWPSFKSGDNIWGVQHLLHPDMAARDTFAELYFGDALINVVRQFLGLEKSEGEVQLVMELFNLLVSPAQGRDFELGWHRDDVRPEVTEEEEGMLLEDGRPGGKQAHAQWNVALYEDESLIVIPGSHKRIRTATERNTGPYDVLPDQLVVELNPGDAVFYDSNILHRGVYKGIDTSKELGRMTLHGSVGLAGHDRARARNVLQHGVGEWVERAKFDNPESKITGRAEGMRRRLIAMGKGEGLGYSLDG